MVELAGAGADVNDGVAEAFEIQTFDMTGITVAAGEALVFDIDDTLGANIGQIVYTNTTGGDLSAELLEADIAGTVGIVNGSTYTFTNATGVVGDLILTQSVLGADIGLGDVYIATSTTGSDSAADNNDNVINGGAGDDVIVLSSDATNSDDETIVYTGYAQGNDTVVHFESGQDTIDLSAYLINTLSASGSEESQLDFALVTGGALALQANSVSIIDFEGTITAGGKDLLDTKADDAEFADFTAADLEAALEKANNGVTTTATTDLYQDNAVSIIIVHNNEQVSGDGDVYTNEGEYKIFEVSYNDAAGYANADTDKAFTAKLIGTVDMGDNVLQETDIVG